MQGGAEYLAELEMVRLPPLPPLAATATSRRHEVKQMSLCIRLRAMLLLCCPAGTRAKAPSLWTMNE